MLICNKCNKEFPYQSILNRHLNKKNGCGIITNTIANEENNKSKGIKLFTKINYLKGKIKKLDIIDDNDNKCGYCKKIFSTKGNLKSHIENRCKYKISILNSIKELEAELIKPDNEDTPQNNIKTLKKIKNITNNNTNNTTNNNTNNTNNGIINNNKNNIYNITLNPFGKEDLSHITNKQYIKFMKDIFPGFLNFVEKIHYDEAMPANHNICIKNKKYDDAYVYKKDNWQVTDCDEIIDDLIRQKTKILNEKYEELEENNETTDDLEQAFSHFMSKIRKSDDEGKTNLIKQLKRLLYNYRNKIERIEKIQKLKLLNNDKTDDDD